MYGNGGKAYRRLSRYNLKELHMWAAEGIAQTCHLTYADSATGLGPDEMMIIDGSLRKTNQVENGMDTIRRRWVEPDSHLWIDVLDRWKWNGAKGVVPGLEAKKPVVYTEAQRLSSKGKGRDYTFRKTDYLLRPEVTFFIIPSSSHMKSLYLTDGGVIIYPLEDDGGYEVARMGMGNLRGD